MYNTLFPGAGKLKTAMTTQNLTHTPEQQKNLQIREFLTGVRDTFPLIVGAIPFGIIFGTLSIAAGLSVAATLAMSAIVFAGSAQFIAVGLVAAGSGWPIIVLTTFVVNLRHALYSATLAPFVSKLPHRWQIPLAFWLTDETFAVVVDRCIRLNPPLGHTLVLFGVGAGNVHQLANLYLFRRHAGSNAARCRCLGTRFCNAGHIYRHDVTLPQKQSYGGYHSGGRRQRPADVFDAAQTGLDGRHAGRHCSGGVGGEVERRVANSQSAIRNSQFAGVVS